MKNENIPPRPAPEAVYVLSAFVPLCDGVRACLCRDPIQRYAKMKSYTAFVPNLVIERIAKDPQRAAEAYEEKFPAALLFVDIVGYVRLTGRAHEGVERRERRGTAMERLHNNSAGSKLDGAIGVAGLTGKTRRSLGSDALRSIYA